MKRFAYTLALLICVCLLPACQDSTVDAIPEIAQDNWTQLDQVPSELILPNPAVPDTFLGMSYDDALEAATNTGVDLTWVGKLVLSPSDKRAIYSTNKTDLVQGTYSLVLLNLEEQTEQVVVDTGSHCVYPLWWWDEERLIYQKDADYYLLDISSDQQSVPLSLLGNVPHVLSYDQGVFIMAPDADNTTDRSICKLVEAGGPEIVTTCAPEEGKTFMAECDISQTLHLAAFKERDENNVRSIVLFDYETGHAAELPLPEQIQSQNGEVSLTDLCFSDEKLIAFFSQGDGTEQVWVYNLSR